MIEHILIKNFRAFKDETIILGDHTLFIGTHSSGKTTILKALDAFFNHTFETASIRHKQNDFIVEIAIDQKNYRKVFSPPHYQFNPQKSTGDFQNLHSYAYLYLPKQPLMMENYINQLIGLYYTPNLDKLQNDLPKNMQALLKKNTPFITNKTLQMPLKPLKMNTKQAHKKARFKYLKTPKDKKLLLGIDLIEQSFLFEDFKPLIDKTHQCFIVSKQKQFINNFDYHIHPLYRSNIQNEVDTLTKPLNQTKQKPFILVEGKYDVPWFENVLKRLNRYQDYRVMPCGGYGNIQFVEQQLQKAGYKTLIITDGDVTLDNSYSLKREVIEQYADHAFINRRFNTNLKAVPGNKHRFFKAIPEESSTIKRVLATYPLHHLPNDNPLIAEIKQILNDYENNQGGQKHENRIKETS